MTFYHQQHYLTFLHTKVLAFELFVCLQLVLDILAVLLVVGRGAALAVGCVVPLPGGAQLLGLGAEHGAA